MGATDPSLNSNVSVFHVKVIGKIQLDPKYLKKWHAISFSPLHVRTKWYQTVLNCLNASTLFCMLSTEI